MTLRSLFGHAASTLVLLVLAACGGGGGGGAAPAPETFTIGGTVTGLAAGQQVTLRNNAADPITRSAEGAFTFTTPVASNGVYAVTVATQPAGQTCTVTNGTGTGVVANITTVTVTCSTNTFTIGGTVTGLAAGQSVTLANNGADPNTRGADGAFAFAAPVAFNSGYAVTVSTQPTGQTCTVSNGTGTGVVANVTNIAVACSTNTFTVGGTVTGLASGQQVTLNNNGADPITQNADGTFTFAMPVAFNGGYAVTVATQPTGQTCSVANGTGAGVVANIGNVAVTCSTNTYTIAGAVTGLASGQQVTLNNNAGDPLTVAADGAFVFQTPVVFNGAYAVTVGTQPTGQTCSVANGAGAGVVANVSNVAVTCSTNTYTIGVTVSGLNVGQQVTLNNNGADPLTVLAAQNGTLRTFATPVTFNGSYAVTVGTQPTGQTCTVSNGTGAGVVANIANVTVACSTNTYTIGVTVSGLNTGEQVTLNNNGGDPLTVIAAQNGTLRTFATSVAYGGSYAVTVGTQPTGQTCTVMSGTGTNVTANVNTVTVGCSTNMYTIGGTISGLVPTLQQVTLNNNAGDPLVLTGNGNFTFSAPVAFGTNYAVTVGTQPTNQTCRVTAGTGSGSNVTNNVASVNISCRLAIAYVSNGGANTISQFTIGLDGALSPLGTSIPTGATPRTVAVDPTGRFAYVANSTDNVNAISQYTIAADGTLVANGTVPTPGGVTVTPWSIAIDPTGQYAFVSNQTAAGPADYRVSYYTIGAGGALTLGGDVSVPSTPYQITVSGTNVYVANLGTGVTPGNTVSQFKIGAGGVLTPMTNPTVTAGSGPLGVTVNPAGTFAYVTNFLDLTISQFSINATTGELTAVGSPFAAGNDPYPLAITPDGLYAFYSNKVDDWLKQCSFGGGGVLNCSATTVPSTPTPGGQQPLFVVLSPFGKHAYVPNYANGTGNTIGQFEIGGTGLLTALAGPLPTSGTGAWSIATTK